MKTLLTAATATAVLVLVGCSSSGANRETASAPTATGPYRFLAFVEGDYQSNYEPSRETAQAELEKYQGKVPDKKDSDAYLEYLSALIASNQRAEAEKKIREYIGEYPADRRAPFLLAVMHLRAKKNDLAQYFFAQLEKDPKFPWKSLLYNNQGLMALEEGNRPLALSYLEKATKADPRIAAPFVNLGALYLQSRSYGEAERLFKEARSLDDDFEDAALGLGVALEGQARFDEAHAVYADFLGDHSGGLSVLFNDAVVLGQRLGKKEEAAPMLQKYLERGGKEQARANEILKNWR